MIAAVGAAFTLTIGDSLRTVVVNLYLPKIESDTDMRTQDAAPIGDTTPVCFAKTQSAVLWIRSLSYSSFIPVVQPCPSKFI
jgi:hypothetical protein